jgi:predicted TIM-barrel fold metal-dependent hydrolase
LPLAIELGWANNVCFASDYPHFDAVYPGAVDAVRAHGLDPRVERRVLADNALAFYGDRLRRLLS